MSVLKTSSRRGARIAIPGRHNGICGGSAGEAGFTLVELLASLTILALLTASVPGIIRMAGQSMRVAGDITRAHADIPALDAISGKLAEARPIARLQDDGSRIVEFFGTETSVRFLAPGTVGASGGLIAYELGLAQNRAGQPMLALARVLSSLSEETGRPQASDIRVPMPATHKIEFRYFGPRGDDLALSWGSTWENAAYLPQLVEIRTLTARRYAPQIRTVTVPLRLYQAPDPNRRR